MKTICTWCGETLGYKCPECGDPLTQVLSPAGRQFVCAAGLTTITHEEASMPISHGICDHCKTAMLAQETEPADILEDLIGVDPTRDEPKGGEAGASISQDAPNRSRVGATAATN